MTLSAGILISSYIYLSPWTRSDLGIVKITLFFWICFPHIAAGAVLLVPFFKLHRAIERFKLERFKPLEIMVKEQQYHTIPRTQQENIGSTEDVLFKRLQTQQLYELYRQLGDLKTYPFNKKCGAGYAVSYLVSIVVPISEIGPKVVSAFRQ